MNDALTDDQIKILVDRGIELRSQIDPALAELKLINATLVRAGLLGDQIPLNDDEREGMQYLAKGSEMTVPIVFESDPIIGQYQEGADVQADIENAAGDKLELFFQKKTIHKNRTKDGKQFRELAHTHLGDKAPAFITLCVARDKSGDAKSKIVVAWDRAEKNPVQSPIEDRQSAI